MTQKCRCCLELPAVYDWQPFGPDETLDCFVLAGNFARGFPVVKICSACKDAFQQETKVLRFHCRGKHYAARDGRVVEVDTRPLTKTIIQVTVLSEEEYDPISLVGVAYDIGEGDHSGEWHVTQSTRLTGQQMAKELQEQGSDPEFFQIDEEVIPLDTE